MNKLSLVLMPESGISKEDQKRIKCALLPALSQNGSQLLLCL